MIKRISEKDAFRKSIVILKDFGNLSFHMIAKLLKGSANYKRNIIYYYKKDKKLNNK
ncbi:MAG: hypothetical protein AABY22_31320 [Nanoarchaeota archaeon]